MKLQKHEGWKFGETYFDNIFVLEFFGQKTP